jgi:DNA repair protein RecN (Recombination protein N)
LSEYITDNRTITLRREIKRSGGGKAYIGEKPVNLSTLKKVAGYIVSILGQHSHQSLLNPSTHINYLDDFTGLDDDLAELKRLYNKPN